MNPILNPSLRVLCAVIAACFVVAGCAGAPARTKHAAPAKTVAPTAAGGAESAESVPDKDLTEALLAGEFAWQDGRHAAAAKHYARAAELSDDPRIAEHATRVAIVAKEPELVARALERWRALQPDALGVAQAQAAVDLQAGRVDKADAGLAELLGKGDDGRKLVAQFALAVVEPDVGVEVLRRLGARADLGGGPESAVMLSQAALHLKKDDLSRELAQRAIARFPNEGEPYAWRAQLALNIEPKDKKAAKADFEHAMKLDRDNKNYRLSYAALLDDSGDPAAAARVLSEGKADDDILVARAAYAARADDPGLMKGAYQALKALPEPRPAARLELLGQLAELTKQPKEALAWYRDVPRGDHYLAAQLRIVVLLDGQGDREGAATMLRALRAEGIDDDEKLAESFLLEAELAIKHKDKPAALVVYGRGLDALPDQRKILYARALLNEQMDQLDAAEKDLRRVVDLDPEDADALNALGYTLADRTDRYDEALELIEKALKHKPNEPAIVDSFGWVQFRMGRRDEAVKQLSRAFELKPDPEIAAHLGEALWAAGRKDEARKVWAEGRKLDPENELLAKTVDRLTR